MAGSPKKRDGASCADASASLFAASPTTSVVYACNLPAPSLHGRTPPLDLSGQLPSKIGRDFEGEFVLSSYPGGQVAIVKSGGEKLIMQFRWICVTANVSIGSVWRFFVKDSLPKPLLRMAGDSARLPLRIRGRRRSQSARKPLLTARLRCGPHDQALASGRNADMLSLRFGTRKVTRLDADGWASANS